MVDPPPYPGTPRWLKVSGIIALILILLVFVVLFIGGGNHGPNRHSPSSGTGDYSSFSRVTEHRGQQL